MLGALRPPLTPWFTASCGRALSGFAPKAIGLARSPPSRSIDFMPPAHLLQLRLSFTPVRRRFATSAISCSANRPPEPLKTKDTQLDKSPRDEFARSEKAEQAAQVNLRAKLTDRTATTSRANLGEVRRLLSLAKPELKPLLLAILLMSIASGVAMSIPFSIGKIIDTATSADPSQRILGLTLSQFYGGLAGIFVLGSVCNFGRVLLLRIVGERVVARTRARLFQKTLAQDGEFFDANRHGDIISRLSSDTTIVGKAITQNVSDGLRAVVQAGAAFGMMGYVSLQLTGIMTFIVPPIAIAAIFYGRYVRDLSKKTQKALGDLTKVSEERLGNVRTAQSFSGEVMEVRRYNERIREIFQLAKREATASGLFFSSNGLAGNATVLAVLGIGGRMVADGTITVGELSSFMLYTAYAGFSMVGLSSFYSELMKGVGAASRLFELLDRKPSIKTTTGLKLDHLKGHIQFKDVKFAYPTRPAVTIFNRLSFEILPGRNYAIVGPSGGGKSTISALIQRFYDPLDGQILIDEHDIRTLNLKHLRRQLSLVSQEPVLFSGTIAENISYGKPGASFNEIVEAARKANCRFIADFPDGFETKVGPRGTQLSGGQKQRIAIARALIRNPAVLIMDEATSALDARSESLVNEALQNIMAGDLTTITIAHRLATIRRADSIIVLSPNGDVAEQGTFDELIAKDGAFARLMEFQLDDGVGQFKRQDSV